MSDLLIKGGTIVDGTGAPRFQGDVLVEKGKVKSVGKAAGQADKVIDATGLVVMPGMIDTHTHYDAQLLWEPRGTSSCWHGVTTVMMGHCGYSMAPVRPEDRDYIARMFVRVEEMPLDVLQGYVPWSWISFPEYMTALDQGLGINAVGMVGHSTLRRYVMGQASRERDATAEEIQRMRMELRKSVQAGAFGFTTSLAPTQNDWDWGPVPSRYANKQELVALASVLRDLPSTGMGLIPKGILSGMTDEDKDIVLSMCLAADKPLQLQGDFNFMAEGAKKGATIWGFGGPMPGYRMWTFREGTNTFNSSDIWREVMDPEKVTNEDRLRRLGDPAMRQALRDGIDEEARMEPLKRRRPVIRWEAVRIERAALPKNRSLDGKSIKELAEKQGKHVADVLLDLAIEEDFNTDFRVQFQTEVFDEATAARLRSPHLGGMGTDSAAHQAHECRSGAGTYFLRHWVIDGKFMSLEEGVRKVTSLPAHYIGLKDRGVIKEGMAADIMVFDPTRVDALTKERSWDLPGGGKRWVQKASGVEYVVVNGRPTIWQGKETGDLSGKVLRSSSYR